MTEWKMMTAEPSLDELLGDEIMRPVMHSAGVDATDLLALLARTAERLRSGHAARGYASSHPAAGDCQCGSACS